MPDDVKKNAKITQFTSDIFAAKEPDHFLPQYELVLSIEVAEHVERTNHDFLFDFLVKHCKKWIIFSGARVGQGGHGHIAERPEEEWRSELVSRGMHFRADLTSAARTACDQKNVNHRRNVMVFEKSR
jgi:cyclopropane fatty-acyl-phospholipid synthase-like methyltransferase